MRDKIKENNFNLDTITDDLQLFLSLFEFDTKEENQINSENIITREVKLRDRI